MATAVGGELFTFGKFRGSPSSEVPDDYLMWCAETFEFVPLCVITELRIRAAGEGWNHMEAQATLEAMDAEGRLYTAARNVLAAMDKELPRATLPPDEPSMA